MNHITIDCETGETTTVPLTADEIAERAATAQEAAAQARQDHAALMEQRAADQADHALIRAAASGHAPIDQAFAAAVARHIGAIQ